jgi:hypothetical protein
LPIGSGPFDNAVEREYGYRNGRQLSHYLIDVTARYGTDEHDGAVAFGFRVYNETFGIVGRCWDAFAAIRPTLIYIPK